MPQRALHTPLGDCTVSQEGGHLVALDWGRGRDQDDTPLLREACSQIQAYFDCTLRGFELPLAPHGTAYQQRVWAALRAIPPGETRCYGELAGLLGSAARAVGQANAANPIPILIPCHRVVAAGGRLGGYSGGQGIETKRFLLAHEARMSGLHRSCR